MINWTIGIVALIVVLFLAKKGCRPAVWLFVGASAGLYIFLIDKLAAMELPWQIGAGILWFVVFLLAAFVKKNHNKAAVSFLLIAVVAIGCMAFFAPKANAESNTETKSTIEENQTANSDDPNAEWAQWSVDRGSNRFIAGGIDAETPEKALENKLTLAKHDAVTLTMYAFQAKLIPVEESNISRYLTEDGKYLNETGKALWYQLKGNYAGTTNEYAAAPNGTVNSGTEGSGFFTAETGGITGDTKTLVTTYPNGYKTETLTRCGNPVFTGSQPGVPTGTTDNPTPPSPPSPPTPPDNPLEPKNPEESTLVNPAVDDWKKDDIASGNETGHTVSNENGATVSNGYQADPIQDAADAKADADSAAAENTATHEDAVNEATNTGGGAVNDNQGKTEVVDPATTDPNW